MLTSIPYLLRCLASWLFAIAPLSVWAQACPVDLPVSQTFAVTLTPAVFTVPNNVTRIRLVAVGASGGVVTGSANSAGGGARAEGTYNVASGQTVTVIVGAPGANGPSEAGGGGASGAYIGSTLAVIAGGGGGEDNTGNGAVGTTTLAGSNGGNPAGQDCSAGGLGGLAGAGGQFGEIPGTAGCQTGDGGGGGGGINGSGGSGPTGLPGTRTSATGGGQCSIAGAAGGSAGTGNPAGSVGVAGGYGICGGGGADFRESGGGGGYSGGGGGPEGQFPGGGGSFVSGTAATPTLVAGALTTATVDGLVRVCYALPVPTSLAITKNNSTVTLVAGSTTTYNIVVSNNGPGPADQAVLRDPLAAGLSCTSVNCASALGGASCPPGGSTTIAQLQSSAGISLPIFPANSSLTFTVTCGVTATGQ